MMTSANPYCKNVQTTTDIKQAGRFVRIGRYKVLRSSVSSQCWRREAPPYPGPLFMIARCAAGGNETGKQLIFHPLPKSIVSGRPESVPAIPRVPRGHSQISVRTLRFRQEMLDRRGERRTTF